MTKPELKIDYKTAIEIIGAGVKTELLRDIKHNLTKYKKFNLKEDELRLKAVIEILKWRRKGY